jgi:hypothetical protein
MLPRTLAAVLPVALVVAVLPALSGPSTAADPLEAPVHSIALADGAAMSPAFDAAVSRYTARPTSATAGTLTVTASTSDPDGTVRVNGVTATGATTVSGLEVGDEVSVIVDDDAGSTAYALVYVPRRFPAISTTVNESGAGDSHVLLTLAKFTEPAPSYELALDRNGVPAYLRAQDELHSSVDLKPAPGGHYTVMRSAGTSPGGVGNWELVELDEQFRPVRTLRTVGLQNTDSHDAILRADGSHLLVAYELDPDTGLLDAVIQDISAEGEVLFEWNSADRFLPEETTAGSSPDYAHINSVDETADGNLLVSFRHTSSVMKIARVDQGDVDEGDVIWRLGGRFSDFDFVDDPDGTGPCAQHTATEVEGGHVLVYDNGSGPLGSNPSYCVDQSDPRGPAANRYQTRVTEYALDEAAGTASLDWVYQVPGRYAYFAGSAYRVTGGRTLIGWASAPAAIASEVSSGGALLWEIRTDDGYFTYRAFEHDVPDAIAPEVVVTGPADGASYARGEVVVPGVWCTDHGGSTLRSCTVPEPLDTTTPGRHEYQASATDGAGNISTATRSYTVRGDVHRPDLALRASGGWVGAGRYGDAQRATVHVPRRGAARPAWLRLSNAGSHPDRFIVRGGRLAPRFSVTYRHRGRSVSRIGGPGWRTPLLAPGERLLVRVQLGRTRRGGPGGELTIRARSTAGGPGDRVVLRLRS